MKQATLPAFLCPKGNTALTRIGKNNDGGYLVELQDVQNAECLLGLGINDDWSFEKDFCAKKDVNLLAFDASVSASGFLKRALKTLPAFFLPVFVRRVATYLDYKFFFRGKRRHIRSFVGVDAPPSYLSMRHVFDMVRAKDLGKCFLKVDIEGSEYRILEDLIENAQATTGLAIEFHDCDLNMGRIETFVARYPLHLVHVHANNFSPLTHTDLPLVLELTFSEVEPVTTDVTLPHPADMPNNKRQNEICFLFE
jgi:hypothetical protein